MEARMAEDEIPLAQRIRALEDALAVARGELERIL
jgi:hypothetical protein